MHIVCSSTALCGMWMVFFPSTGKLFVAYAKFPTAHELVIYKSFLNSEIINYTYLLFF